MPRLHRFLLRLSLLTLLITSAGNAQAAHAERNVAEAVDRYIDAMMRRDTLYLREAALPQATFVSVSVPGDTVTVRSLDEFVGGIGRQTRRFVGRVWSPRLSVNGGTAVFSAPYDAWYDGTFSHCGVDNYLLVRDGDRWLVSHLVFTRQREHCAPSPLGRPN